MTGTGMVSGVNARSMIALSGDYDPAMSEAISAAPIEHPAVRAEHAAALIRHWPGDSPLILLHSGRTDAAQARWSILTTPAEWLDFNAESPLAPLEQAFAAGRIEHDPHPELPFIGGWIGCLGYDAARRIEPAVDRQHAVDDRHWPAAMFAWCPAAILLDRVKNQAWLVGSADNAKQLAAQLDQALASMEESPSRAPRAVIDAVTPTTSDAEHRAAVERTIQYIAAGDIFQANITRRWSARFAGSPRAVWLAANEVSPAWFGALLEGPDKRSLVSMSPELFLRVDPRTREVVSRPIKGTRPARIDPDELRASEKDAAELHMIVDLMRNDLGRVCKFGSVRVREPRAIESHPTVHHGVAEVVGILREGATIFDLLRASFPPGSVTGAPKIRAMQIIDELEPVRRGPYCGAIGFIDRRGGLSLNVAIRTIAIHGDVLDYHAGGGIVADSDPDAEVAESHAKAEVFRGMTERLGACDIAAMAQASQG